MRLSVRSTTLGGHTHLHLEIDGRQTTSDPVSMRNDHVADFLMRLRPDELTDETPEGHEPVAARWRDGRLAEVRRALPRLTAGRG
jgi:hypothetical protein